MQTWPARGLVKLGSRLRHYAVTIDRDACGLKSAARADAVKRPHDENIDSRARGRRKEPRIAAPAELADLLASDLDVPARGSAHAPGRRGGTKIVRR